MSNRDYERELENLYNGLAESVFEMSDEEVRAEMHDGDPDALPRRG